MLNAKPLSLLAGAAALALGSTAAPVVSHANTYTLSDCATGVCSPQLGNNLGTITTTDISSTEVEVDVSLASGINWVGTGNNTFSWSLSGQTGTLSVENLTNDGFSSDWTGLNVGTNHTDGMGSQGFWIDTTLNGNSSDDNAALVFDLVASGTGAALSTADFVLGGTAGDTGKPYYFLADLYCGGTSCGDTGMTGLVGAAPAPPIGRGLPVVLAVGGLLFGARLWDLGKKRFLAGAASPQAAA
jgi:hypothetical protein